jgi:hypothetical protein
MNDYSKVHEMYLALVPQIGTDMAESWRREAMRLVQRYAERNKHPVVKRKRKVRRAA